MILSGEILRQFREKRFKDSREAYSELVKHGYPKGIKRYWALERGEVWPGEEEARAIVAVMGMTLDFWLLGDTENREIQIAMAGLSPQMRKIAKNLIKELARSADAAGL